MDVEIHPDLDLAGQSVLAAVAMIFFISFQAVTGVLTGINRTLLQILVPPTPTSFLIPNTRAQRWRDRANSLPVPALSQAQGQTPPELASIPPLSPTIPQVRQMEVEVTFLTSGSAQGTPPGKEEG